MNSQKETSREWKENLILKLQTDTSVTEQPWNTLYISEETFLFLHGASTAKTRRRGLFPAQHRWTTPAQVA
jgi:hypothetical protein